VKVTVEIDCTPEEARAFLGLPDLRPMQDELLRDMQARMASSLQAVDPQEMIRQWLTPNLKGFEQMMDAFTRMSRPKQD
jgi:hypothetical protein